MNQGKIQKIIDAEKIAAGEVIERPANVVKELIENSIDAKATEIKIIIKKAGKVLIQVIDNGMGIAPEDIEIAFERHTSSKIRKLEDLNSLSTLGFRGEALASIAAVSNIEITSRTKNNENGIKLILEVGKIVSKQVISCPVGTNIMVKNLFYNIPARLKFLKKDTTELGHITDIIQRYALSYPEIHFYYTHNDLVILNCPKDSDLKTTVYHIYGKNIAKAMEQINHDNDEIKVKGLLGHPSIARKSKIQSSLFINRRYIMSNLLSRAIKEAYKGILMTNQHPFYIIFLELDPSFIDFNVHPKKLEVRFEDEDLIYNKLYRIVRNFIEERFMKNQILNVATDIYTFMNVESNSDNVKQESQMIKLESEESQSPFEISELKQPQKANFSSKSDFIQLNLTEPDNLEDSETLIRFKATRAENFPKLRLISNTGQLSNKIYIVLEGQNSEGEDGMFILDQHAASERINKEYFLKLYDSTKRIKQKLISPLKLEVSASEKFFLLSNLNEFKKLGFDFEHFGGNTFVLREIPTIMNKVPDNQVIKEIISDLSSIGKDASFDQAKEKIINYLACHRSIRGGDDLSIKDIRKLIENLSKCENPFHCAHGRPTLKFFSFKDLDKLFKRIV
ncbi:MAG: DNA mismatch repair endonuclease MutL [Promethearchaeota archaeon]